MLEGYVKKRIFLIILASILLMSVICCTQVNDEPFIEQTPVITVPDPIDTTPAVADTTPDLIPDPEPVRLTRENLDVREYTDSELRGMLTWDAELLKGSINTRADAIAFLNMRFPELRVSCFLWDKPDSNTTFLHSGEELLGGFVEAGRSDIATAVAYLLCDNADEIGVLFGFYFYKSEYLIIRAATYIYIDGEYHIFDPVVGMDDDRYSRLGEIFFDSTVSSFDEYITEVETSTLFYEIDSIYVVEGGQDIWLTLIDGKATVTSPEIEPIFINTEKDKYFDWYINQLYTGEDAFINCGPAVAVMAARWHNPDFTGTVEEARNSQPDTRGKWWFYRNIRIYLEANNIDITYLSSFTINKAIEHLDKGRIIIANIKCGDISFRNDETQIGRYYQYDSGHFIILKGYTEIDDIKYFIVYDPFTIYDYRSDGTPKGKDRLFNASEVSRSIRSWGDSMYIVIYPSDKTPPS